jgi:capsule polysaccharide export protein KpsE/RkpR
LDNLAAALPESTASMSRAITNQESELIDQLCRRAQALDAVLDRVRIAMEQNQPDVLCALRGEFDALRDQLIDDARRLARRRLQYRM